MFRRLRSRSPHQIKRLAPRRSENTFHSGGEEKRAGQKCREGLAYALAGSGLRSDDAADHTKKCVATDRRISEVVGQVTDKGFMSETLSTHEVYIYADGRENFQRHSGGFLS